jgi:hypothetical protein
LVNLSRRRARGRHDLKGKNMTQKKADRQGEQKRPSQPQSQDPSTREGRQNRHNQEGKTNQDRPLTFEEGKWETGNRQRNLPPKKPGG